MTSRARGERLSCGHFGRRVVKTADGGLITAAGGQGPCPAPDGLSPSNLHRSPRERARPIRFRLSNSSTGLPRPGKGDRCAKGETHARGDPRRGAARAGAGSAVRPSVPSVVRGSEPGRRVRGGAREARESDGWWLAAGGADRCCYTCARPLLIARGASSNTCASLSEPAGAEGRRRGPRREPGDPTGRSPPSGVRAAQGCVGPAAGEGGARSGSDGR